MIIWTSLFSIIVFFFSDSFAYVSYLNMLLMFSLHFLISRFPNMPPLTRTSKCLRDKSSDEGETDKHPSFPNKLMESPS